MRSPRIPISTPTKFQPRRARKGKPIPIEIKTGDKVLFGKWSGTKIKLDGEELLIMKESDIMGVLN